MNEFGVVNLYIGKNSASFIQGKGAVMKKLRAKFVLAAATIAAGLTGDAMIANAAVRAPVAPVRQVTPVVAPVIAKPASLLVRVTTAVSNKPQTPVGLGLGVKSSGEVTKAVPGLAVRPPYRPPPRSPYRPPARPPFGP
jgi:hypothetical protein